MSKAESVVQRQCVSWFRMQFSEYALLLNACPNGGKRSRIEAAIMKGEGVTAGVADLMLFVPRNGYHGLFIEIKRETIDGRKTYQSPSQKIWQAEVQRQGYKYCVCRSLGEFMVTIKDYIYGED